MKRWLNLVACMALLLAWHGGHDPVALGAEMREQTSGPVAAVGDVAEDSPNAAYGLDAQNLDPMLLVKKISETSVEELTSLSFIELNILKNAVYAVSGYKFAEDKIWLRQYFCGDIFKDLNWRFGGEVREESLAARKQSLQRWRKQREPFAPFDLSQYGFPGCRETGEITEEQKLAAANVRIAIIKKLEQFQGNLEAAVSGTGIAEMSHTYLLLGKFFPSADLDEGDDLEVEYTSYLDSWKMSLKRELMGLNQLIKLMNRLDDFDQMELLGLYAGDIALLKNIIEAKHGKPFQGVTGWEISRLIGVTDVNPEYDPSKLPIDVQVRIQILDETIRKILRSDLNDLPKGLRGKSINIEILEWYSAAC